MEINLRNALCWSRKKSGYIAIDAIPINKYKNSRKEFKRYSYLIENGRRIIKKKRRKYKKSRIRIKLNKLKYLNLRIRNIRFKKKNLINRTLKTIITS